MAETQLADPIEISLDAGRGYSIHFCRLADLPDRMAESGLRTGRCLLITDENVAPHYWPPLTNALEQAGWTLKGIVVPPGESTKSADPLRAIYDEALAWGIDRQTPVLALGGGVVGDLAGFAAATLLRGLPLIQIPTSLIAQVDSSIGGKTGINHALGKNLIGAFYQPEFIATDLYTIDTLPQREWTSGMAEVVKHALIADPALVAFLDDHMTDLLLRRDRELLAEMTYRAAHVKARVVSEDERETGRRAILNFGHTFGHAIERVAGYGVFTHGEAVAIGMRAALHLSHRLHPTLDLDRADRLVQRIPIEGDIDSLSIDALLDAMKTDKKAVAGTVRFVVLDRIGHAYLTGDLHRDDLLQAWEFVRGN